MPHAGAPAAAAGLLQLLSAYAEEGSVGGPGSWSPHQDGIYRIDEATAEAAQAQAGIPSPTSRSLGRRLPPAPLPHPPPGSGMLGAMGWRGGGDIHSQYYQHASPTSRHSATPILDVDGHSEGGSMCVGDGAGLPDGMRLELRNPPALRAVQSPTEWECEVEDIADVPVEVPDYSSSTTTQQGPGVHSNADGFAYDQHYNDVQRVLFNTAFAPSEQTNSRASPPITQMRGDRITEPNRSSSKGAVPRAVNRGRVSGGGVDSTLELSFSLSELQRLNQQKRPKSKPNQNTPKTVRCSSLGKSSDRTTPAHGVKAPLARQGSIDRPSRSESVGPSGGSRVRSGSATASIGSSLYERGMLWRAHAAHKGRTLRMTQEQHQNQVCTFQPRINGDTASRGSPVEYLPAPPVFDHPGARTRSRSKDAGLRLHRQAKAREQHRQHKQNQWEVASMRECTFVPRTHKGWGGDSINPRYLHNVESSPPAVSANGKGGADGMDDPQCTFKPRVNAPRVHQLSDEGTAYLQTNAFERLSTNQSQSGAVTPTRRRRRSLIIEGLDSPSVSATSGARPRGSLTPRRAQAVAEAGGWVNFQQRQQNAEDKKKAKREAVIAVERARSGRPFINGKSREIIEDTRRGDFFERMVADQQKRLKKHEISTAVAGLDKDHTFKPSITREARQLPRRSFEDLCYTDQLRRDAMRDRERAMQEQRQLDECTFQPVVSSTNGHGGPNLSRLTVARHPEQYGAWLQSYENKRRNQMENAQRREQDKELQECTFWPQLHSHSPDYGSSFMDAETGYLL